MVRRTSRICLTGLILGFATASGSRASAQPASLVKDINPGQLGSYPFGFQELGGGAFFLASNTYLSDLWRTDGTEVGTNRAVATDYAAYSGLVATSRRLFWLEGSAGGPNCCPPPWLVASDGTQTGTSQVTDPSGFPVLAFGMPVAAIDQVFVLGSTAQGNLALWRSDGTAGGTRSLAPFSFNSVGPLLAFHDSVAFLVDPAGGGRDLWRSDGSPQGTTRVTTLTARASPACVGALRRLGRAMVFLSDDGSTGCNVWRSDGTAAGTVSLGVVGAGASAQMSALGSARGIQVFANLADLWRTDGTVAGTFLLKSFPVAALSAGVGTREGVYFTIQTSGIVGATQQLWITDGTALGTILLHDFKANGEDATIASLTTANGRLLASITGNVDPFTTSLWTSDGTPAGTVPVQQNVRASGPAFPYHGVTLFAGTDPSAGMELWAMDGTSFAAPVRPSSLSLLAPCRVIDTRVSTGFLGGPGLAANAPRLFPIGDACGIPATARAIAANVTVTAATADGILKIHPSDIGSPETSVINFRDGQTRANNATITLGPDAEFTVRFETSVAVGQVHVIVDVVGFFE